MSQNETRIHYCTYVFFFDFFFCLCVYDRKWIFFTILLKFYLKAWPLNTKSMWLSGIIDFQLREYRLVPAYSSFKINTNVYGELNWIKRSKAFALAMLKWTYFKVYCCSFLFLFDKLSRHWGDHDHTEVKCKSLLFFRTVSNLHIFSIFIQHYN